MIRKIIFHVLNLPTMKSVLFVALLLFACSQMTQSQGVAIAPYDTVAHPSAGLDVNFANKGILIPRVSLTSITDTLTIPSPATSLLVFNTNPNITNGNGVGFYYYCSIGCATSGWKFMNYSENGVSTSSEWTFHSKYNFNNSSTPLNVTSLPPHNKWKLVIQIFSNSVPLRLNLQLRVNNITSNSYGTRYTFGPNSPTFTGNYWSLFISGAQYELLTISGEIIITDRFSPLQDTKTFTATLGYNVLTDYSLGNHSVASEGYVINDINDIHTINFSNSTGPITGRIELWYRDYK